MAASDDTFLFEAGDYVLYEVSGGRLLRVFIIERLYEKNIPEYQVRHWDRPNDKGVPCLQSWLRPHRLDTAELKSYMETHSPPMT